jgi:glycosyltransferase involved in cell wall biosynthesis
MIDFADLAGFYSLPARDPSQPRPNVTGVPPAAVLRRQIRRALGGGARRMAYLDSTFPWARSGFRYHEASALLEVAPDTMFFSLWEMTDPFPAPVHPLADFPRVAVQEGITDAYGVFQLFLAGLVGLRPSHPGPPHAMEGPDLSHCLRRTGIRLHGSIYPGGGFTNTPQGLAQARALAEHLSTTFSYVPEVLANVPGVTPVDQAFTETRFYAPSDERWKDMGRIVCLFAADAPPRKGLEIALGAFAGLPSEQFHLHVVGPHEHRRDALGADLATFHGWLSPSDLRDLHRQAHIFISPVSAEPPGPPGTFAGVTDGFPTQAAADAMSSGCLLISANPASDHRVLDPDVHYLDCEPDTILLRQLLLELAADHPRLRSVAQTGSDQVRARMDVRHGALSKLVHMGFAVPEKGQQG